MGKFSKAWKEFNWLQRKEDKAVTILEKLKINRALIAPFNDMVKNLDASRWDDDDKTAWREQLKGTASYSIL
jgi:hypothetical protein